MIPLEKLKTKAAATNQPPTTASAQLLRGAPGEATPSAESPPTSASGRSHAALVAERVVEQAQQRRACRRTRRRGRRRPIEVPPVWPVTRPRPL